MKLKLTSSLLAVCFVTSVVGGTLAGCTQSNDRTPTAAETKAADTKRQNYIDQTNLPPDVKAQMKSHMGGPPATNPATANGATGPAGPASSGRRN